MTTAAEYAQGLRELADWMDAHPEIDIPDRELRVYTMNTKEQAAAVIRALKPCKKAYKDDLFDIYREFGPIKLSFVFYRDAVCRKKVVGKKRVEAYMEPGYHVPAKMVDAHEEDIIEWECGSALKELPDEAADVPEEPAL